VLYGQTTQTLPGPVTKSNGGTTQAALTLTRTDLGGGDFAIEARIASDAANYVTFTWHQQSHLAMLSRATDPLASGLEQANVLETDNPASLRVQQALDFIVNTGLVSANWRPDAAAKLWPPPPSATGGVAVLPGLDWVLFCRRRDCLCNIDTPPAPARAFQVWAIDLTSTGLSWDTSPRDLVLKYPTRYTPTKIDVIEFPAASYELKNADKAPQRWAAVIKDPGYVVQWAGIAMSGIADASWIERNRLDAYESAIASVAPSVPGTALREVLSYVPPGLSVPGTDGIVVLLIARQTMSVYRLLPWGEGLAFLKQASGSHFQEGVSASYLDSVALTRSSRSMDSKLIANWAAHNDGPPYGYLIVSKAQGIDHSRLATRAKDLVAELGGTLQTQGTRTDSGANWPLHGSDAVIVLLPWVLVVAYQELSAPSPPVSLASRITKATRLGVGRFQPDRNELDNAQDFLHKWEGQTNGIAYLDVDVYTSSGQGDDSKIDSMQSGALLPRINAITKALDIGEVQQIPTPISLTGGAFTEAPFIIFIRVVLVPR
jgi:hypothetical protein